jgi:hypothetical protein
MTDQFQTFRYTNTSEMSMSVSYWICRRTLLEQPPSVRLLQDHISIDESGLRTWRRIAGLLPRYDAIRSRPSARFGQLIEHYIGHVVTSLDVTNDGLLPRDAPLENAHR